MSEAGTADVIMAIIEGLAPEELPPAPKPAPVIVDSKWTPKETPVQARIYTPVDDGKDLQYLNMTRNCLASAGVWSLAKPFGDIHESVVILSGELERVRAEYMNQYGEGMSDGDVFCRLAQYFRIGTGQAYVVKNQADDEYEIMAQRPAGPNYRVLTYLPIFPNKAANDPKLGRVPIRTTINGFDPSIIIIDEARLLPLSKVEHLLS